LTETVTKEACKRELQVEIPADVVSRETDIVIRKLQKLARLPGFRRGKVPASIIQKRFGDDVTSEVVESLVPKFFEQEAERQGLRPISRPSISDLELKPGEPMRFKATFEVLPEIEVAGYEEIRAEKRDLAVSEEEIEEQLTRLREQQATFSPVEDRPTQDGDFAQVSFTGTPKPEGSPAAEGDAGAKPATVDDVMVEIGGSNTVREFSEALRGARPGEQRSFDVSYPADFSDQRLAGKTVTYAVTVKGIKKKETPELNDEFARQLGDFAGIGELKQRIREGLEHEKQHSAEREAKEKLIDELVRRHDFPVPEALIERQVDVRLERGLRALTAQGMSAEAIKKMDLQRLRAGQREAAMREVKASLILDKIAATEKIEVSDEEVDKEVQALATQMKQTPEAIRARLTRDGALDRIRNRIRSEKTLDFLYSKSA
jgi:trigger factor